MPTTITSPAANPQGSRRDLHRHKNAKARIVELKPSDVVVPDQVVDKQKTINLGGTTLELIYVGKNHSDSTLVMRLPKENIFFTVDWIPLGGV